MRRSIIAAAAFLLAGGALPAAAQSTRIEVPATASWQHAQTKLIVRPQLAGMPRTGIADLSTSELDISIDYGETNATWATLYIFRPAGGGLPVWYDRAETQILKSTHFPGAAPQSDPQPFAPPKASEASGLRRVFVPTKGARSTALAVMPIGDWLVAIRLSSATLDPAAIDTKLSEVIAGLGWPDGPAAMPVAAPITGCPVPLAYPKKAKLKKPDIADGLIGAMLGAMANDDSIKKEEGKPIRWCREGEAGLPYATYRDMTPEGMQGYLMAVGDAGRTIGVFPTLMNKGGYQVSLNLLDATLTYPSFDRLPRPEQALEAVQKNAPISSAKRGGKEITISQ